MTETLQRNPLARRSPATMGIRQLLRLVGVARTEVMPDRFRRSSWGKSRLFWQRPVSELYDIYETAHARYRERIKVLHPDRNGDQLHAACLNEIWKRIDVLFERNKAKPDRSSNGDTPATPESIAPKPEQPVSIHVIMQIGPLIPLQQFIHLVEREYIRQALAQCDRDKRATAQKLGTSIASLYRKLKP